MAETLCTVSGDLETPGSLSAVGGKALFLLSTWDAEAGQIVVPSLQTAVVQAGGTVSIPLWPNVRGERNSFYQVTYVSADGLERVSIGQINVPDESSADLNLLILEFVANEGINQTAVQQAIAAADAAAASAASADADATAAAISAANAAISEAAAQASAIAAGAQIFADTTAGIAGTSSGDLFYVPANGALDVYENDAGSAVYNDTVFSPRFAVLATFKAAVAAGYTGQPGAMVPAEGVFYEAETGAGAVTGLPGWKRLFDSAEVQPAGPVSPTALMSVSMSDPEAQAALGIGPRRVLINTAGTHIVNAADYAPALHLLIIPTSTTATLDCAGLVFNAPYEFINAQPSTTVTLDFGEDVYIRSPDISPGITTVRTLSLPPNNRVTVIRIGGNQVFVDYASPPVESGTWTPIFYGSTTPGTQAYSLQQARWLRFGDLVTLNAEIRLSSTSGAAGNLRIGGAPFTALGNNNDLYPMVVPYQLNFTSNIKGGSIEGGTDYISLWTESAGDSAALNASELENASRIRIGGSYMI